jgi:hypothetical protein
VRGEARPAEGGATGGEGAVRGESGGHGEGGRRGEGEGEEEGPLRGPRRSDQSTSPRRRIWAAVVVAVR